MSKPKKVPYKKCGKAYKTETVGGMKVTLYCTRNGNKPHMIHSNTRTD